MKAILQSPAELVTVERRREPTRLLFRARYPSAWQICFLLLGIQFAWLIAALMSRRIDLALVETGQIYAERRFVGAGFVAVAVVILGLANAIRQPRLRWLVLGLIVHAAGTALFGDVLLLRMGNIDTQTSLTGSVLSRGIMVALVAVGVLWPAPPLLTFRLAAAVFGAYLALVALVVDFADRLPRLMAFDRLPPEPATGVTPGFTPLYWVIGAFVVALSLAIALESARRYRSWELDSWFVAFACLLAGFALHSWFRPSLYGVNTEFASANAIMTVNFLVIVLGSTFTLRKVADQAAADRDALAVETRRMSDLERLRADFMTMVAHELSQPLLAIRRTAEVLALDELPATQERAVASITTQVDTLFAMIDDVRASGATKAEDFTVHIIQVSQAQLFERVRRFADTLPGNHPVLFEMGVPGEVWTDDGRIEQVLRNLLTNAGRYTPTGTSVTVRALPIGSNTARIEVEDEGSGIENDELQRVMRKYERGDSNQPGLGVGLYLSNRILQSCGSSLQYRTGARGGACFWFDLPRVS